MSFLAVRDRQPELMDDPDLDPVLHKQALAGLRRAHAVSGTVSTLWKTISGIAQRTDSPLRLLDVACGGGDMAIALAGKATKQHISLEVSGCDISQTAIDYATANAASQQADVHFFHADVLSKALPENYDIVCCSLFLHHLDDDDAVRLLGTMKRAADHSVLVSDLRRSRLGYVLTWCGLRILTRSRICHVDGPLSVRAAFTPQEALDLAGRAGLDAARVSCHWPERFLLTWNRQ